jgi:hypothetical protein
MDSIKPTAATATSSSTTVKPEAVGRWLLVAGYWLAASDCLNLQPTTNNQQRTTFFESRIKARP